MRAPAVPDGNVPDTVAKVIMNACDSALSRMPDEGFWAKQRVFLTGHSGFKGSWLSLWLERLGAEVYGFSLAPETQPNLFGLLRPFQRACSEFGDVCDLSALKRAIDSFQPTVAIHMAAQALVRRSYREPLYTFAVNVMGTGNILEALREIPALKAVVVITTDKVYRNLENGNAFVESDPLGGHDPYSASKAAAELLVSSWAQSFFGQRGVAVATVRAGNVIGGGDWSENRLIPDVWRAVQGGKPIELRYPRAIRPWQHVLEPLAGYLAYAEDMASGRSGLPESLNFGPDAQGTLSVSQVAEIISKRLGKAEGWVLSEDPVFAEMQTLALDATLATETLHWRPKLSTREALEWTAEWYQRVDAGESARTITTEQISRYVQLP
jgi:CDP-glucose 4,6-dehydratase